jgi:phospholipid/cholesterol/gamma-HCH transport system substrate-binding protein
MRRILVIALLLGAGAAFVLLTAGSGSGPDHPTYTVELDNAFGLTEGSDVKVAGVRAGKIEKIRLDQRTKHALVDVGVTATGFGSFRSDVTCAVKPQSLIGEYFVDCDPGKSGRKLAQNARIPVSHTSSTISIDLVNNIMRRPYRERLRIIVGELGAAVGGRGPELNEAIRRASPALQETDKVLAKLAVQNRTIERLTVDGDKILADLAGNKKDVGRWVQEANNAATASAERREQLAGAIRRLPAFLAELGPTMQQLGNVADEQTPTLRNLDASARQLTTFFDRLGPFSDASRPAFRSLAEASKVGRRAAKAAVPTIKQLEQFSEPTPELAKNLAITLEDLDSRDRAIETDPRSPGGKGYTGLESLLQYVFDQSLAINIFDGTSYLLKVAAFVSETCGPYAGVKTAKAHPECRSWLGPDQAGITTPGETPDDDTGDTSKSKRSKHRTATDDVPKPGESGGSGGDSGSGGDGGGGGSTPDPTKPLDELNKAIDGIGGIFQGRGPAVTSPVPSTSRDADPTGGLLDYLLRP